VKDSVVGLEGSQRKLDLELNPIGQLPNFTLLRGIPRRFQQVPLEVHNVLFPAVLDGKILPESFI